MATFIFVKKVEFQLTSSSEGLIGSLLDVFEMRFTFFSLSISPVALSVTLQVEPESTRTPSSRFPPSSIYTARNFSFTGLEGKWETSSLLTWRLFPFLGLLVFFSFVLQTLAKCLLFCISCR